MDDDSDDALAPESVAAIDAATSRSDTTNEMSEKAVVGVPEDVVTEGTDAHATTSPSCTSVCLTKIVLALLALLLGTTWQYNSPSRKKPS